MIDDLDRGLCLTVLAQSPVEKLLIATNDVRIVGALRVLDREPCIGDRMRSFRYRRYRPGQNSGGSASRAEIDEIAAIQQAIAQALWMRGFPRASTMTLISLGTADRLAVCSLLAAPALPRLAAAVAVSRRAAAVARPGVAAGLPAVVGEPGGPQVAVEVVAHGRPAAVAA